MPMARGIVSFVCVIVIACDLSLHAPRPAGAEDFGSVNGTWEGRLYPAFGPGLIASDAPLPIRIVVQDEKAQVFTGDDFTIEAKPGAFKAERLATSMVIFSMDSGRDHDGVWVATWAFVVTQKNHDTLITNFYRVVNNTGLPTTAENGRLSTAKAGELKRGPR